MFWIEGSLAILVLICGSCSDDRMLVSLLISFLSLDLNDELFESEILVGHCCLAYDEDILRHSFLLFGYLDVWILNKDLFLRFAWFGWLYRQALDCLKLSRYFGLCLQASRLDVYRL